MLQFIQPKAIIISSFDGIMELLEAAGRTCYRSEDKINSESAEPFIRRIIKSGHKSVLEHASISVKIFCSRSCSHQLVRHRIAAYSQESQRYCDYSGDLRIIMPKEIKDNGWQSVWMNHIYKTYELYKNLKKAGYASDLARSVLPNATATTVFTTFNLRQWRHVFKQRGLNKKASNEIRSIFQPLLGEFAIQLPAVFDDLAEKSND